MEKSWRDSKIQFIRLQVTQRIEKGGSNRRKKASTYTDHFRFHKIYIKCYEIINIRKFEGLYQRRSYYTISTLTYRKSSAQFNKSTMSSTSRKILPFMTAALMHNDILMVVFLLNRLLRKRLLRFFYKKLKVSCSLLHQQHDHHRLLVCCVVRSWCHHPYELILQKLTWGPTGSQLPENYLD